MEHIDGKGVPADELQQREGRFFENSLPPGQYEKMQEKPCEKQEAPGQKGEIIRGKKPRRRKAQIRGEEVRVKPVRQSLPRQEAA